MIYSEVNCGELEPQRRLSLQQPTQNENQRPKTVTTNSSGSDESMGNMGIPIRRRSLLTPGIATRTNSMIDGTDASRRSSLLHEMPNAAQDSQNQPWQISRALTRGHTIGSAAELHEYYYNPVKPTESPLERLAALDLPYAGPRAETPSEVDYRHIGTHKFGSLRIANADASPPSARAAKQHGDKSKQTGFTGLTSNTGHSDLEHSEDETTFRRKFDTETGSFVKYRESKGNLKGHNSKQRMKIQQMHIAAGDEISTQDDKRPQRGGFFSRSESETIIKTVINRQDEESSLYSLGAIGSIHRKFDRTSPTISRDLARAYMMDIPSSPFSFENSDDASPLFQNISPHTTARDHPADGNDTGLSIASNSVPEDIPSKKAIPATATATLVPAQADDGSSDSQLKPLSKADSGYSSTTSIRASECNASFREHSPGPEVPLKTAPPTPPKIGPYKAPSEESKRHVVTSKFSWTHEDDIFKTPSKTVSPENAHELTTKSERRRQASTDSKATSAPAVPKKNTGIKKSDSESLPQSKLATPYQQSPNESQQSLAVTFRSSQHSHSNSSSSELSSSSKKSIFSRARSVSQPADVTVQCIRDIAISSIPNPSREASARLDERIATFPPLEHTYKTVHKTNSKDTLATFLTTTTAAEKAEEVAEAERFKRFEGPLPKAPEHTEVNRVMTKSSNDTEVKKRSSSPHPSRKSIESTRSQRSFAQILPRKSADIAANRAEKKAKADQRASWLEDKNQEAFEAHITSFGTVAHSLGASPYDLAISAIAKPSPPDSRTKSIDSATAAYSVSNMSHVNGRARGMDSAAAAQFAREKSEMRRKDLRRMSHDVPSTNAFSSTSAFNDRGGVPGKQFRHSSIPLHGRDVPPVPALPSAMSQEQRISMTQGLLKRTKSPPPVSMPSQFKKTLPILPMNSNVNNNGRLNETAWVEEPINLVTVPREADGLTLARGISDSELRYAEENRSWTRTGKRGFRYDTVADPRSVLPSQRSSSGTWQLLPAQQQQYQNHDADQQQKEKPQAPYRTLHSEERSKAGRRRSSVSNQTGQQPMHPPQHQEPLRQRQDFSRQQPNIHNNVSWSSQPDNKLWRKPSLLARNSYDSLSYRGAHPQLEQRQSISSNQQRNNDWQYGYDQQNDTSMVLDRYSGGVDLDYNENGYPTGTDAANRRKPSIDRDWGVDWSDVPIGGKRMATVGS